MAITVDYGSISDALGLAQRSGRAQRQRSVAAQDLAFIQMMQQAQADADRQYANEVQAALGVQQANADRTLRTRAMDFDQRNVEADNTLATQQFALQRQRLAAEQQRQQQQDQAAQQLLGNNPQAILEYQATGKVPETALAQNPSQRAPNLNNDLAIQAGKFELEQLKDELAAARRERQNFERNALEVDPSDAGYKALLAAETQANAAVQAKVRELQNRMAQMAQAQASTMGGMPPPNIAALLQAAKQGQFGPGQQASPQQPAPAAPAVAPGSKGPLTPQLAVQFLQQAGGNKDMARQLALQAGYSIPA